ncbi:MAG: pyridoxal-phosphate dependent enzyme [Polaribacter sp.]|nr:pyridoxal-phosphate dependent enzyme [Polaribacter sp.]
MFNSKIQTENQQVFLPVLQDRNIKLFVKREDSIHPFVSGNKFRKLKYNLAAAYKQKHTTLLTFGGAFSNHIAATAVAGKSMGFKTIGIIRGDELGNDLEKTLARNATLREAYHNGMKFWFVSRAAYREKSSKKFLDHLKKQFGNFYLVPEGGTNTLAVKGCEEILMPEDEKFDYICVAVGTGGTIAGLINSAKNHQKVIGFPALKGDFLTDEINLFTEKKDNWRLENSYHFGGYGKSNSELITFINSFKRASTIPLDPIYTGKMLFGILDLIERDQFSENSKILAIHTGGLQGIKGFNERLKQKHQRTIE